ncbi:hypothetical protein [Claveliimonas bilis]|uniref:hypothetical protein n=1 Tax=Claveliimonas bilis TaxID=3028070 RepID=UPI00292CB786|nr:hypothetical protein [Claveliimonas bilis]BDZ79141.1 hypothetical protein Lac3_03500 [Claveliimonas bilis]
MTEAEMIRNLNSFTKAQIINAIVKTYPYKSMVERLISNLEYLERDEVLQKHNDAIEEESKATKEYIKWRGDMIQKYGTDGKVRLIDIPSYELDRGADLESRMKASREKERRISEKVDSLFGV